MPPSTIDITAHSQQASALYLITRWAFGVIWAVDAAFKYEPAFYHGLLNAIKAADSGSISWLNPWYDLWYHVIGLAPEFWAITIIFIETAIALSLLLGVARRFNYVAGAVFSLLIWSVGEGFGGPYVTGSTDVGAGIIYVLVFILLWALDGVVVPRYCLDIAIGAYFKHSLRIRALKLNA